MNRIKREIAQLEKRLASTVRHCEIYKATDGKWYLELAPHEYGEYEDADTYGPFDTEDDLQKYLDHFSNPGGYGYDDSGKHKVPTKSPNGKPVQKPRHSYGW